MPKSFIRFFLVGAAILLVVGVAASQLLQNGAEKEAADKEYRVAIVDATPVELGVLTEKQRSHSKLYSSYKQMTGGARISERIAQAQSKVLEMECYVGMVEAQAPETPESYFGRLARESDTIVRGRVTGKASQVTEDDSFIFTDYAAGVTEVLKSIWLPL